MHQWVKKSCLLRALVVLVMMQASAQARASQVALDFTSVSGSLADGNSRVIGWEFTVGDAPIWVTSLGVYDHDADGLASDHTVAIYEMDTQQLIVSTTVVQGASADLTGLYRSNAVTPTKLDPNTAYVAAATWPGTGGGAHGFGDPWVWYPDLEVNGNPRFAGIMGLVVDPAITIGNRARADLSSTLGFPDDYIEENYRTLFVGPNFEFSLVPEPASAVLLAIAAPLLSRRRRRASSSPTNATSHT